MMCPRVELRRWRVALTAGRSTLVIVNGDARYQVASVTTEVTHTNIWGAHGLDARLWSQRSAHTPTMEEERRSRRACVNGLKYSYP